MATQYFVTVPGQKKQSVIVSDTASLGQLTRQIFEVTGVRLFNGFGYKGQNGLVTVPMLSDVSAATIWDVPALGGNSTQLGLGTFLVAAPAQPTGTPTTGTGSLSAATYLAKVTYVSAAGETVASVESAGIVLASTGEVTINSPIVPDGAVTGWNCYLSASSGTEKLQNASPVAIGTNLTVTSLLTVTAPPVSNTCSSPILHSTMVSSIGIASGDELIVFNVPVGG